MLGAGRKSAGCKSLKAKAAAQGGSDIKFNHKSAVIVGHRESTICLQLLRRGCHSNDG